ncbi:glycosyltransferase [Idiomarina sp. HP20-50]|uniref:glycosyltransferase n=1 Tax=Idiomarina sp. HP20-50 TaxID=3070813 RepID=UPI00294AFC19|nr:glycosyltransferase [Idiomarina sp. HP20-50]MDV6316110.1 hypothetical protein [Idiomarina sp. HP20-50]
MNMIFHFPLPLDSDAKSASGIRPLRMIAAFESLGYKVDLVTGYSNDRKDCIAKIKEKIRQGEKYDFVYSESSTMPTTLTERHHLPLHPFLDWFFFRFCNKKGIPIGLFYRDIYWKFDNYGGGLNRLKKIAAKLAYQFDIWVYKSTLTKLYLPSVKMADYIPEVNFDIIQALPPGHSYPDTYQMKNSGLTAPPFKLFYVGGMSEHYQLHKLFEVVRQLPNIELTICTRLDEWVNVRGSYPSLTDNIKIVHKSAGDMEKLLSAADIAILFIKPQEYREFAAPVKLYEYIGHRKPIIASEKTLAGRFVEDNGLGWTIPYEEEALKVLLNQLLLNPQEADSVRHNLVELAPKHSWLARANKVAEELRS